MRHVLIVLAVLAAAGGALAQTPVIVPIPPQSIRLLPDQNLTQAMEMVGCNGGWLSAIVAENKIPVNTLGSLTFGSVYAIPAGVDCRDTPPPEVAAASRAMAAARSATVRASSLGTTVRALESEVASLKADLAAARASDERTKASNATCADAKAAIETRLQAAAQDLERTRADLSARWPAWGSFLFGFLAAAGIAVGFAFARRWRG
jgi:hypothetical protein